MLNQWCKLFNHLPKILSENQEKKCLPEEVVPVGLGVVPVELVLGVVPVELVLGVVPVELVLWVVVVELKSADSAEM